MDGGEKGDVPFKELVFEPTLIKNIALVILDNKKDVRAETALVRRCTFEGIEGGSLGDPVCFMRGGQACCKASSGVVRWQVLFFQVRGDAIVLRRSVQISACASRRLLLARMPAACSRKEH